MGLLALLAAQAAVPSEVYPLQRILDESRDVCALLIEPDSGSDRFVAKGWRFGTSQQSAWLADYMRSNRKIGPALKLESFDALYEKQVAGRNLILYVFGLAQKGSASKPWGSCEVMDLTASGVISNADVVRWAGREPAPSLPLGDSVLLRWVPSLTEGAVDSSVTYSPAGSPLAEMRPGLIYTLVMPSGTSRQ